LSHVIEIGEKLLLRREYRIDGGVHGFSKGWHTTILRPHPREVKSSFSRSVWKKRGLVEGLDPTRHRLRFA